METRWGNFKVRPNPHGKPRILETVETHPDFVGIGLKETDKGTWEKIVFALSSDEAVKQVKQYLASRGEAEQKFFEIEYVVATSKDKVSKIAKWMK